MIYLDSAATSFQKPPAVAAAMQWALRHCASVGRGGYAPAMQAAKLVFRCRALAAALFDAQPEQVVFTMNATHGLNLALHSLVPPGGRVVISGLEHNAVTRPLYALGAQVETAQGALFAPEETLAAFRRALERPAAAVVCTQVSNVFGAVLPVQALGTLCRERGVPLIIDASQAAGVLPVSLAESGAAFIAMPGHKGLYGPQGTGILLCAAAARPLLCGGTGSNSREQDMPDFLPDRLEAGTHNVVGIAGLYAGLQFVQRQGVERIVRHERALLRRLERSLEPLKRVHLLRGPGQVGVLSFTVEGLDCEEAAARLAAHGVAVRAGLHCAPLAHRSAGTLDTGTVRASLSAFNTAQEMAAFAGLCGKLFS